MDRFRELVTEAIESLGSLLRQTKDAYEGASRYARMRLLILVLLAVDVFAVFIFIATFGSKALEVTVWFEKSFPSNMLIVRNESGDPIDDVKLTLDGRFVRVVKRLEAGPVGFEVSRDFFDPQELTPEDDYQPQVVLLEADGEQMTIEVSAKR